MDPQQRELTEALRDTASMLLRSTLDLDAILDGILSAIARVIQYDSASVMLIENDDEVSVAALKGYPDPEQAAEVRRLRFSVTNTPNLRHMAEHREAFVIADTTKFTGWVEEVNTAYIRSSIGAPMRIDERVIGFVNLDSATPNAFSAAEGAILQPFADLAAVAVRNARLFAEMEHRAAELAALQQVNLGMAASLDLRQVLDAILFGVLRLMAGVTTASIYLYRDGVFTPGIARSAEGDEVQFPYEPRPTGIHYTVARSGEAVIVEDMRTDPLFADAPVAWEGATVAIPLKIGERVVGVMRVYYEHPRRFDDAGLDIFWRLGDQAAVAIENARLFQNLQESEERFRQLAESTSEVFWLADPASRKLLYVSPAYEEIWGASPQPLLEDPQAFAETVHPDDRERVMHGLTRYIMNATPAASAPGFEHEYRILRPDGEVRWVRTRFFTIENAEGVAYRVAALSEDITVRKQAEVHEFDLAVERERVRLLQGFISDASHDLKTPISVILTKLHLLKMSHSPERRAFHIEAMEQQAQRLDRIINNLLILSRLDSVQEMSTRMLEVDRLLFGVVDGLEALAQKKGITLTTHIESDLPHILANEFELNRALVNLTENALNYTAEGGQIRLEACVQDGQVVIGIHDTGIGIAEEDLPRIFDRFYRADKARATDSGGTGLGLPIARKIIELHHGRIDVASTPGEGTQVRVYLPPFPLKDATESA